MADTLQSVTDLPEVSFIDDDTLDEMRTRMVANFESEYERITGKKISLSPSDPNRITLYAHALELYQVEQYIDRAGKQDLIKYSYGEFLDNLGAGRGVTRKQPAPAETILRFTLSEKRPNAVGIPEGTKVTNGDLLYFETEGYDEIPAGDMYVDIRAVCTVDGVEGNEQLPGQINILVDLIPYVASVENITESSEGADLETDESMADRIFLAPSGYSVAGPDDAYKYWAKTYSQMIGDVNVTSPDPVEVEIRFLMTDGSLPTKTTIEGLTEYLQDNNIRPLTDKVTVLAPEAVNFNIGLTYYVNRSDQSKAGTIQSEVSQAISDYIEWQTYTIGRDINPSELIKRIMAAGAKRVEITSPVFTAVADTSVARVGTQTVTYGGIEND
jgi:phage-related baseplate assembly protein